MNLGKQNIPRLPRTYSYDSLRAVHSLALLPACLVTSGFGASSQRKSTGIKKGNFTFQAKQANYSKSHRTRLFPAPPKNNSIVGLSTPLVVAFPLGSIHLVHSVHTCPLGNSPSPHLPCLEQSTLFRTVPSSPGSFPPLQTYLRLTGERREWERQRPSDASVSLPPHPHPPPPDDWISVGNTVLISAATVNNVNSFNGARQREQPETRKGHTVTPTVRRQSRG